MSGDQASQLKSFLESIKGIRSYSYEGFVNQVASYIEGVFGDEEAKKFMKYDKGVLSYEHSLASMKGYLSALILRTEQVSDSMKPQVVGEEIKTKTHKEMSNLVFIVHGHDNEAKESVARFVSKLGLEPIILHERPNSGKTIIEKLESNVEKVAFAIVLLTPDDKGASIDTNQLKYRARQNVIYELGFFNAKLGRDKVCVLKKGDIEVLSDYLGVAYVDMDSNGGWKNQLTREIIEAGLPVSPESIGRALLSS